MKIPVHIAEKLWRLLQGERLPSGTIKHALIEELVQEGIIERLGRIQKSIRISDGNSLSNYLQNRYGINDLEKYIEVCRKETVQRNELAAISSDSKLKTVRTFKGFLVNGYAPIPASLNGQSITLDFTGGIFQFIYDFENFIPAPAVTIVGIENPENFRFVERQEHLFKDIQPLFVSRYPQSQSRDLIKWLGSIPNHYLHFGDFDLAGIGIYLNEFKKHLCEKATFFVPENIESIIEERGNKDRYDQQKVNFATATVQEEQLLHLIKIIHQYKKGADQEILIFNH